MASGSLDWTRFVNISGQDAAELIARAYKGATLRATHTGPAEASTGHTIIEITNRGIILGGFIWLNPTNSQISDYMWVLIDGILVGNLSFYMANKLRIFERNQDILYLISYDDIDHWYCMSITPMLTFETSFKIIYWEESGNTPSINATLFYALI